MVLTASVMVDDRSLSKRDIIRSELSLAADILIFGGFYSQMGALHQSFSEKMVKVNKVFRDNNLIPLHVMLHDTYGRLHKHELKLGYCYAFSSTSEIIKSSPFCGHLKKLYLRTG